MSCSQTEFCVAWGALLPEHDHIDCPVVVRSDREVVPSMVGKQKYPAVCTCDCRTCRRAWWSMDRPTLRDGKVVTSRDA